MKIYRSIFTILLLLGYLMLNAQEVKSEKSSFHINNLPKIQVKEIPDTDPPSMEFISPKILPGARFQSNLPELDLIGKVTDVSGISFVSVNSEIRSVTETGIFTSRLNLDPGENLFRVVAMDQKENLTEQYILIEYTPPVVTLAERIARDAIYYGLIIGIDKYSDGEIQDLDNPVKDAEKLYRTLTQNYNFSEEHVTFIKNATREDIIRSLDKLGDVITPKDNLLIFYAGHGWWDTKANNGFWLPSDADRYVKTNWFRNSTLVNYLKEIDSKHTLLITDACFGGSIFKTRSAFGSREKAYEKLYELPSRKAMTSGNFTEVPDRSSFTKFLIQRLNENEETYLSSEQLFSSFRLAVINNSDAIPMYGEIDKVGDEGGDFIFLKK
ncbi:MAG: caspase family protein [Bacteroidales bacterium]|nr:caspase family protein [Bacteroidales bacterium]